MGASVIITGLSSDIALTLVTIGVDLSKMNAVGDLQGGIEEAERLLGYQVSRTAAEPFVEITLRRLRPRARPHSQAGRRPDRIDPGGHDRLRCDAAPGRPDGAGREIPGLGDHHRRHRARRHGLVRGPVPAHDRPHDPAPGSGDGHRGNPARGGLRHGAAGHRPRGRPHRPRSRRGPRPARATAPR